MNVITRQLGKILLVLAVAIGAAGIVMNPSQSLPDVPDSQLNRPVKVELEKKSLVALGNETFFTEDDGAQFTGTQRAVWVKEKVVVVFQPVDLDIPPASIMRPPQVLPEPGPSLEGSHKLPRFGEEFAPITMVDPKTQPKSTTGAPLAPATTPKPATGTPTK